MIAQLESQGFTFPVPAEVIEVDDARTITCLDGVSADGRNTDVYFLLRGPTELQVNCQWETQEAEIDAACVEVLDSLQIIGS
ncbi:hypothetical protein BH20ACT5_BH20ACT5_00140 [soil metagenome]